MQNDPLFFFRLAFGGLFVAILMVGASLIKNYDRLFGADSSMPSENGSSRAYTKVQVFTVWAHAAVLTGAMALLVH